MSTSEQDRAALLADADVRRRAREVCKLIGNNTARSDVGCADLGEQNCIGVKCDPTNCYVWELIEMGRVGHPE